MKTPKPPDWSDFDWLWVELSRAVHNPPPGEDIIERLATPPWESSDQAVLKAWGRITDPENREKLMERLQQDMNPTAETYTRKALEICLQRSEEKR